MSSTSLPQYRNWGRRNNYAYENEKATKSSLTFSRSGESVLAFQWRRWRPFFKHLSNACIALCLICFSIALYRTVKDRKLHRLIDEIAASPHNSSSTWTSSPFSEVQPRMLVLQHLTRDHTTFAAMHLLSVEQHAKYAAFWGYDYVVKTDQYVSKEGTTKEQRSMNKLYALLDVVNMEIEKGDQGAEWIFMTDADVLILNPAIPLHALLPPPLHDSKPLIVGSEDHNGLNAGNLFFRVNNDLVQLISRLFLMSDDFTTAYQWASPSERKKLELPPSDQRVLCLLLQEGLYVGRFWHFPQHWLNAYWVPPEYAKTIYGLSETLVMNIHFVGGTKNRWGGYRKYRRIEHAGWDKLDALNVNNLRTHVNEVQRQAGEYWQNARRDAPTCYRV